MSARLALSTAAASLLALASASGQASYTAVPDGYAATDITPDGKFVVGAGWDSMTLTRYGYIWDWKNDPVPTSIGPLGDGSIVAVSDDGTRLLGNIADDFDPPLPGGTGTGSQIAALYTMGSGWQSLGYYPTALSCPSRSSSYDLSSAGTAATGLTWDGCDGRAFHWTPAGGMVAMDSLGNGQNRATVISPDGSIMAGFAQGNFSRTPAYWHSDGTGVVLDMDALGEFYGCTDDGDTLLGVYDGDAVTYEISTGTLTVLGTGQITAGWSGNAVDVSEPCVPADRRIIGYDNLGLGLDAWQWTAANGLERLDDVMALAGVPGVPHLDAPQSISADGSIVVGHTNFVGAWVLELPVGIDTVYSGCGGNPAGSLSVLCGKPSLGNTMVIGLDNPLGSMSPGALSRLTFSLGPLANPCGFNLPGYGMAFNGAIGELLITLPKIITISGAPWDGANPAAVPVAIPSNPPLLGVTVYAQGALVDVAGGVHIGLTEAISLTFGQ